jgi:hypothetical protein
MICKKKRPRPAWIVGSFRRDQGVMLWTLLGRRWFKVCTWPPVHESARSLCIVEIAVWTARLWYSHRNQSRQTTTVYEEHDYMMPLQARSVTKVKSAGAIWTSARRSPVFLWFQLRNVRWGAIFVNYCIIIFYAREAIWKWWILDCKDAGADLGTRQKLLLRDK